MFRKKPRPQAGASDRRGLFRCNIELNLLKNPPEHSAAAVREHIRPALLIMLYISPNGHRLHRPRENPDRGMVDAGRGTEQDHPLLCIELGRRLCHGLHPKQHDTFVSVGARYRSVSMNTSQPMSPSACLILFFALS